MPTFLRYRTLLAALVVLIGLDPLSPAGATERIGVVLLHGKTGTPQQMMPLAALISAKVFWPKHRKCAGRAIEFMTGSIPTA
jgi:hypothetical protein